MYRKICADELNTQAVIELSVGPAITKTPIVHMR